MEMYKGISMRFFFLLHVFDIFHSVLTNYKMILLLSIQFHGFRVILAVRHHLINWNGNVNIYCTYEMLWKKHFWNWLLVTLKI